ncbi:hypothetical protein [Streptomyces sp. NPDC047928]|uniref:hypothetical protein n=1 Tax=unclassified Streptomyces TaxID=2593676 RepID=UPI003715FBC2
MRKRSTPRTRLAGGVLTAVAVAGLALPGTAYAAGGSAGGAPTVRAAAGDAGTAAAWRTISTYRTAVTCQAAKLQLELSTPWVLRCQAAGVFTHHLQRYS